MPDDPEYTGPPIGEPPEHVHDNAPVVDVIDQTQDEVDELQEQVSGLESLTKTQHAEMTAKVDTCLSKLEALSTQNSAENPLLTQLLNQLVEIRSELSSLKSSMDTRQNLPPRNVSEEAIVVEEIPSLPNQDESISAPFEVENPTPKPERKTKFV
jgi:chromosome segregation ATPase